MPSGSLPLMGIRNYTAELSTSWGSDGAISSSLPLMGIRNVYAERCIHAVDQLTTPHGDQKPPPALRRPCDVVLASDLTTPHGDQKRRPRAIQIRPTSVTLTTPHGDQKHCRSTVCDSAATTNCPAHYPSWGSETSQAERGFIADGAEHLTTPHGGQKLGH